MHIRAILIVIALLLKVGVASGETAATVVFATGAPTAIGVDGVPHGIARGSEISSGETIDTADGRVQLRFRDGASMSLQPATRFRVDDYHFAAEDGRAAAESKGFFSLIKGGLRTITGLIGKGRREQYRVGTVVATIGIRGTEYGANLAADGLRVTTFVGLVEVCNTGGCQLVRPGETVLVEHPERKPKLLSDSGLPGSVDVLPQMPTPGTQPEPSPAGRTPLGAGPSTAGPGAAAPANATPGIAAPGTTAPGTTAPPTTYGNSVVR